MEELSQLKVKGFIRKKFTPIPLGMTLRRVIGILSKSEMPGLPVVDNEGNLKGIITKRRIISLLLPGHLIRPSSWIGSLENMFPSGALYGNRGRLLLAEDVMETRIRTVKEDTPIFEVAVIMEKENTEFLPVLRGEKIVGIITRRDIIKALFKID